LKRGVLFLRQAFGEVRHASIPRFSCGGWIKRAVDRQPGHRRRYLAKLPVQLAADPMAALTSNSIYQSIGYVPDHDAEERAFS